MFSGIKRLDFYLVLVLGGLTLAQFVLFLPNNHVVSDIWDYWRFQETGISLLFQPTTRPLAHSLFWVLWSIDPHSWTLLNLTQVVVMVLKAVTVYWFVAQILTRPAGLLAGALILVFPASFGVYSMWTVNVNLILVALIVALASLVWISRAFNPVGAVLLVLGLGYSLLSYEMGWPLALFGPAVLLISGPGRFKRRALILWYGTLIAIGGVLGVLLLGMGSHVNPSETGVHFVRASSVSDLSPETLPASIASFFNAYRIHLVGVFEEATAYLTASKRSPLVLTALACGAAVGVTVLVLMWRGNRRTPSAKWAGAAVLGLAYIGLGYAPIAITLLRTDRFHEFIYSSLGAALFFAAVLFGLHDWLSGRFRAGRVWSIVLAGVSAVIMALFTFRSLDLTLAIIATANAQKAFGESIVRQVPAPEADTAFVVFDTSDARLNTLFEVRPDRLRYVLGTVYENQTLPVFVCRDEGEPGPFVAVCEVREDGILVRSGQGAPSELLPLERSVVFRTVETEDGLRPVLDYRGADVPAGGDLPRRIGMVETVPLPMRQ